MTFVVCANATVFMSGDFWALVDQNMEETVLGFSGETLSKRQLFPGPKTGTVRHSFQQAAGETVIYTKTKSQPRSSSSSSSSPRLAFWADGPINGGCAGWGSE